MRPSDKSVSRAAYLFLVLFLVAASQFAFGQNSRAFNIANITGSMLGKATHCGFPTDEFAGEAGRVIDLYAVNNRDRKTAIEQFTLSATMSARSGPVGESCSAFRRGYLESLRDLKAQR